MTSATLDFPRTAARPLRLFDPRVGGPTLETLLSGVWEGLAARGSVACPICAGELTRDARGNAAHCRRCGTELG